MYECVRKSATEMDSWNVMDGEEHSSTRGGKNGSIISDLAGEYNVMPLYALIFFSAAFGALEVPATTCPGRSSFLIC